MKKVITTKIARILYRLDMQRKSIRTFYLARLKWAGTILFWTAGLTSIITLTIEFGFYYPDSWSGSIASINHTIIDFLISYEIISFFFTSEKYKSYLLSHKIEVLIVSLILTQKIFEKDIINFLQPGVIGSNQAALIFLSFSQVFLIISNVTRFFRSIDSITFRKVSPSLIFSLSFILIICIGTLALHMPKAQKVKIASIDILFTVVSSTCVTGLSTIDISQSFTRFGQLIVLALIQVGGLGVMTLTSFFAMFLAGKSSVTDKVLMKDLLSEDSLGKVSELIKEIALYTLVIEAFGALLLYIFTPAIRGLSVTDKIFYSVFHSVSAFCNAGFSLFSGNLAEHFIVNEKPFLTVIMMLIIFGGIGFSVISQVIQKIFHSDNPYIRFTVSTKLVLVTNTILLLFGGIAYFILETKFSLAGKSFSDRIFHSFFYSVTSRTAGFNTLDMISMGMPMVFVSLMLMWIGASPNSTGGGIKTTTFAVSIINIYNIIRGKNRMELFRKTISPNTITRASAAIVLSLFIIFTAIFALLFTEKSDFMNLAFEVVSAFGTVGLSRGITTELSTYGKIIISCVMFTGRVGILTILIALTPKVKTQNYSYPEEFIIVG